MIARDHNGQMLKAKSSCKQGSMNPELTEAIGIREALNWVKEQEWTATILESDCLFAVQAIRCSSFNFSYFGRVIDECKKLLVELESRNVVLKFVKRSANKIPQLSSEVLEFSSRSYVGDGTNSSGIISCIMF